MQSLAKIASRGSQGHFINATNQAVASLATTEARAMPDSQAAIAPARVIPQTRHGLSLELPRSALMAVSGIGIRSHIRLLHTDMEVPDFSYYRRNATKDGSSKASDSFANRAAFTYLLSGALGVSVVYAASKTVNMFVGSMSASADVLALSKIEVNLGDIPEGKSMTFKWRGKPLFVRHRTAEEIAGEEAVDVATLRDPQTDSERAQNPKFLVVVGVCTHLGCVPVSNAGEYGGYYCPCHGSHYDSSGRIRKGPAPLNLEVPEYRFVNDVIVVG